MRAWLTSGAPEERWLRLRSLARFVDDPPVGSLLIPHALQMETTPRSRRLLTGLDTLTGTLVPLAAHDVTPPAPHQPWQAVHLPAREPGVYLLTATFALDHAQAVHVLVQSPRPVDVRVDDRPVARVVPHGEAMDTAPAQMLGPGTHVVQLLVPVGTHGQPLTLGLVRGAQPPQSPPNAQTWPLPVQDLLDVQRDPDSPAADRLEAQFPQGTAHDIAHLRHADLRDVTQVPESAAIDALLSRWPTHADAQLARIIVLREGGQPQLAQQALDLQFPLPTGESAVIAAVQRADVRLERARMWLAQGLADWGMAQAEAAAREHPHDCATQFHALTVAEDTLDRAATRRLLPTACTEQPLRRSFAHAMVGQLHDALRLAQAAVADPEHARDAAELVALIADALHQPVPEVASPWADNPDARLWRAAQQHAVAGNTAQAQAALQHLLTDPGLTLETRQRALQAGAVPVWQPFVQEGEALAQVPLDEKLTNGAATAWLLDQEIVQLLPDGGAIRRVHQVVRVLEDAAADAVGEVRVGEGADLELARTILEDGTVLLPAETDDKETISLRAVSAGTTVEFAQIAYVRPDDPATGATRLPLFEMQSTSAPIVRSEYVVLVPAGLAVTLDASAAAGPEEVRQVGTMTAHIYRRHDVPRLRFEPRSALTEQVMPTVRALVRPGLAAVLEPWQESLAAFVESRDPALRTWRTALQRLDPGRARWQQLAAKLALSVQHQHEGGPPGRPETALATGKGDRASTFYTLAKQLGADVCLVRVLPLARERTPVLDPPDPAELALELVRVQVPLPGTATTTALWYDPGLDGGLLDHVRPALRGRRGLLVGCAAQSPWVTVPPLGEGADERTIDATLTWADDGALSGVVHEHLAGSVAHLVRSFLRGQGSSPTALVEQLAGAVFVGGHLQLLDIHGLAGDGPVDLAYEVTFAADAARRDALDVDLWAEQLGPTYATLPTRTMPLIFAHALDVTLALEVVGVSSAADQLPTTVDVRLPDLRYQRAVRQEGDKVIVVRTLHTRPQVVAPGAYPGFARALQQIDAGDHVRLRR